MLRFTFLFVVLIAGAGCGGSGSSARDTVSGTVMFAGRSIDDGIVTLHGSDGRDATGAILPGGRYSIDDPPLGLCQVTVAGPPGFATPIANQNADPHAPPPEAATRIPKKYGTTGNGLTVDVKPGKMTFDIVLEP